MSKYKVVYKVNVGGQTADDDCYEGTSFHGTVQEEAAIDAVDDNDADEKAKALVRREWGELVSVVKMC